MQSSTLVRKQIALRIHEKIGTPAPNEMSRAHKMALDIFFDLSLEYESLRDFKTLCVLIPDICLDTPTSLYLQDRRGRLQLRRTTQTQGQKIITFPDPVCPSPPLPIVREQYTAFPLCDEQNQETKLLGVLSIHKVLSASEQAFYARYVQRAAKLMSIKQTALRNRQHLAFISNLVRDIGHNVIVPNMYFKLLFMRMEKQLQHLQGKIRDLRSEMPDQLLHREIAVLVQSLNDQLSGVSKRFQQSSLFLESLLRRSHFEKGHYDLVLKPCKFKSQVIEPQIDRFRALFQERDIAIQIAPDVRIDEDITLDADLGLICQVFANLLSNAVKYTQTAILPSGRSAKQLTYGWETQMDAFGPHRPGVRLFVSTTGAPIPPKDAVRLFEANFRSDASNNAEGTGHGLFFVKQIVELHGGKVGYAHANALNTFHVTLPYVRTQPQENAACPRPY